MTFAGADSPRAKESSLLNVSRLSICILATLSVFMAPASALANVDGARFESTALVSNEGTVADRTANILAVDIHPISLDFSGYLDACADTPLVTLSLRSLLLESTGSIQPLRLEPPQPMPVLQTSLSPTAGFEHDETDAALAPAMIVGAASMYNPADPADPDSGDSETASGETYDPNGWTAAIQLGLRERFGGVRYRMKYELSYALVETDNKRIIVRINDVGPLSPGRVIDLNLQAMRYFDPTLEIGVLQGVRVTPLFGRHWIPGPVEDDAGGNALITQAALERR